MSRLEQNRKVVMDYRPRTEMKGDNYHISGNGIKDPKAINGKYPKPPKKYSNPYSPSGPPISSSTMDLNGKISSSPRQSSNTYSPRNSTSKSMTLDQNTRFPRSPRQPSNAYSTGNIFETSPTKNQSPKPASRHHLLNEGEYIRRYSITTTVKVPELQSNYGEPSSKNSRNDEAPNMNTVQRKSSNIYDNAKDIQPIPTKRNSSAKMNAILFPRTISTPNQLTKRDTSEKVHSFDSVHTEPLSQDDGFFDKVMAFEKNKESSLKIDSGGQIKYAEAIKMSLSKSQEAIISGESPNSQNYVQNSIIIPSKKASMVESLPPNGFNPKSSMNTDQKPKTIPGCYDGGFGVTTPTVNFGNSTTSLYFQINCNREIRD
ncbi:unnamed protein product [Rodentolepis nana]|uniref:Uncharacterized protein n=1 Tax=Rodentolepis nana TaxID=102285 RepID=A0A0R3T6M6_RODNA|nr:unnamed protein product [Rodentolepis nana]